MENLFTIFILLLSVNSPLFPPIFDQKPNGMGYLILMTLSQCDAEFGWEIVNRRAADVMSNRNVFLK